MTGTYERGEEVRRQVLGKEVLLQVAIYAGVPHANRAFAVARDALRAARV